MNSTATVALNAFQQWLIDAVSSAGVEVGEHVDPLGVEFEAEGRRARIIPHRDPALAVIEVEVLPLADVPPGRAEGLAWELLRLNHDARFEHEWAAIVDDDEMLSITTTVVIDSMRGEALGEALFDGVERAARLAVVAEGLLSALSGGVAQAPAGPSSDHLRV